MCTCREGDGRKESGVGAMNGHKPIGNNTAKATRPAQGKGLVMGSISIGTAAEKLFMRNSFL
jgi:hypothetical protein